MVSYRLVNFRGTVFQVHQKQLRRLTVSRIGDANQIMICKFCVQNFFPNSQGLNILWCLTAKTRPKPSAGCCIKCPGGAPRGCIPAEKHWIRSFSRSATHNRSQSSINVRLCGTRKVDGSAGIKPKKICQRCW